MKVIKGLAYGPHGDRNLLDLYCPDRASAPLPLVLCIHGGGWCSGGRESLAWMAEALVGRGFAAACITYRFWPEWLCPSAMDDAQRAVRWLRRHATKYRLDPERFGAIGGSAGAHLAAHLALAEDRDCGDRGLSSYSSRVQCVVDCYGPVDFVAMMDSASAPIIEGFMGLPLTPASEAAYRHASPYYYVKRTPPPFLIVHGTADVGAERGQVPIGISERFAKRLKQTGGEVSLIKIKNAPHGFTHQLGSEHGKVMWAAAVPFFEKQLLRRQRRRPS